MIRVVVALPGLMGSLVVSLCTLWLFQQPVSKFDFCSFQRS